MVQPVKQLLIALGVLDHDFRAAIDRQHLRQPGLFQPGHVGFVVAQKISQRVNLSGVQHGALHH